MSNGKSRSKGKRGEREFVHFLKDHGVKAQRTQQFSGRTGTGDVISEDMPQVHWEVKRQNNSHYPEWFRQADSDKKDGHIPIVVHRVDRGEWMAYLKAEQLIKYLKWMYMTQSG